MKYITLIFLITCFSCSPQFKIQSDSPFPGDFKNYNSFKFYNPENIPASNFAFSENVQKVLFDAVAEEMKSRGYKSIQDADLMIKIQGNTKNTIEIVNDNNLYPYDHNSYNFNRRYGGYNNRYDQPRDQSKKESSIIIDIIDIKKEKIIWHGVGTGSLKKNEPLTELKIREAIAAIFMEYLHLAGEK